ncbi:MAG TPA: GNVR domain-containing protein [Rhodocyclaceae bacterium]
MNFTLLLSALRARFRVFFLIVATTVVAATIASLLLPKTYVGKVSLLLDGKDEQSLQAGERRTPERERVGYMQTQVDILTSPKVAQRVVRDLGLAENAKALEMIDATDYDARSNMPADEWVADRLLKRVKVDTTASSVAQLSFAAGDPQLAAQIANGFAKAYVNTVLDLRVQPAREASAWFEQQLKGLRDKLEQAEQNLAAFRQEHGIAALDERYDVANLQLSDLSSALSRDTSRGASPTLAEVLNTPTLQQLRADLQRAEARLREMSSEFGVNHPQYQHQLAQVASLRAALGAETRSAVTGVDDAVQRTQAQREDLKAQVEKQRAHVLELAKARTQLAVLTHDAAIAQRTYDDAMQRYLSSNVDSRALQTNVSILDAATPPGKPARPRLLLNIGIAALVGILLGLAAVHLLEMFDQRVRLVDDLAGDVQVPLLAVLDKWNPMADRLPGPDIRRALPGPG